MLHSYFQNVCLVDEEYDRKKLKEELIGQWTTSKGFVYPPPKNKKEMMKHPMR